MFIWEMKVIAVFVRLEMVNRVGTPFNCVRGEIFP